MKNTLLFIFILISFSKIKAQDSLRISNRLDSFPTITIKKNVTLQILGIYPTMAWFMGGSCNNYIIGKEKYLNPTPMKPYFDKLGDSEVINDYQQHRDLKPIYLTGYGAGMFLYIYGIGKSFAKLGSSIGTVATGGSSNQTDPNVNNGKSEVLAGLGIILASTVIRIISFSHLHKATRRYNSLISRPKTSFDLKPSQEGLGLGLRMSF
jgi:hypothetical protein